MPTDQKDQEFKIGDLVTVPHGTVWRAWHADRTSKDGVFGAVIAEVKIQAASRTDIEDREYALILELESARSRFAHEDDYEYAQELLLK